MEYVFTYHDFFYPIKFLYLFFAGCMTDDDRCTERWILFKGKEKIPVQIIIPNKIDP